MNPYETGDFLKRIHLGDILLRMFLLIGILAFSFSCKMENKKFRPRVSGTEPDTRVSVTSTSSYINLSNQDNFYLQGSCSEVGFEVSVVARDSLGAFGVPAGMVLCDSNNTWETGSGKVLNLTGFLDGDVSVEVVQADSLGQSASARRNFIKDVDLPIIDRISSSTGNGYYKQGDEVDIEVYFSESVVVTGVPKLLLKLDASTEQVDYFSGSGMEWAVDLNGQSCEHTSFNGGTVEGECTGPDTVFNDCLLAKDGPVTVESIRASRCTLAGDIILSGAGTHYFNTCHSGITGLENKPSITLNAVGAIKLNIRRYSGGIRIKELSSVDTVSLEGWGHLVIDSSCLGGLIKIRGSFSITDEVVGGFQGTVIDNACYNTEQVTKAVWEELHMDHVTPDSYGALFKDMHDEALGGLSVDYNNHTLTLYKADGSVLKVFDLPYTSNSVPNYIGRVPQ